MGRILSEPSKKSAAPKSEAAEIDWYCRVIEAQSLTPGSACGKRGSRPRAIAVFARVHRRTARYIQPCRPWLNIGLGFSTADICRGDRSHRTFAPRREHPP